MLFFTGSVHRNTDHCPMDLHQTFESWRWDHYTSSKRRKKSSGWAAQYNERTKTSAWTAPLKKRKSSHFMYGQSQIYCPPPSPLEIAPPSLDARESLWTEIPYYKVVRFTATFDVPPQTAVNWQWRYIGVWMNVNSDR